MGEAGAADRGGKGGVFTWRERNRKKVNGCLMSGGFPVEGLMIFFFLSFLCA